MRPVFSWVLGTLMFMNIVSGAFFVMPDVFQQNTILKGGGEVSVSVSTRNDIGRVRLRPYMKPEKASNFPLLGQRHRVIGRWSSQPTAPRGDACKQWVWQPPRMSPSALCNAACIPWEVMFPPGEGWYRSISVTCTEKEVLQGDRWGHLLSSRQKRDQRGTCSLPDVLSIIRVRGRGAYFFLPVLSHPASPEENQTRDWLADPWTSPLKTSLRMGWEHFRQPQETLLLGYKNLQGSCAWVRAVPWWLPPPEFLKDPADITLVIIFFWAKSSISKFLVCPWQQLYKERLLMSCSSRGNWGRERQVTDPKSPKVGPHQCAISFIVTLTCQ